MPIELEMLTMTWLLLIPRELEIIEIIGLLLIPKELPILTGIQPFKGLGILIIQLIQTLCLDVLIMLN
jgi:hypothetical protein